MRTLKNFAGFEIIYRISGLNVKKPRLVSAAF